MVILFIIFITLVFVFVVAHLLFQQKDNRINFYVELQKEDDLEIDNILNESKEDQEKFIIVDNLDEIN